MGSIGAGEIFVIVLVALIVFGPHRLPEISRKAGELLAKAREMSKLVTESYGDEFKDIAAPMKDLKSEYDSTMGQMRSAASSVAGMSLDIPEVSLNPRDILKQRSDTGKVAEAEDEAPVVDAVAEVVAQDPTDDEGPEASLDEEAS